MLEPDFFFWCSGRKTLYASIVNYLSWICFESEKVVLWKHTMVQQMNIGWGMGKRRKWVVLSCIYVPVWCCLLFVMCLSYVFCDLVVWKSWHIVVLLFILLCAFKYQGWCIKFLDAIGVEIVLGELGELMMARMEGFKVKLETDLWVNTGKVATIPEYNACSEWCGLSWEVMKGLEAWGD